MKKWICYGMHLGAAMLGVMALGMDLSVPRAARPEAIDLFGYVYQMIARTFSSFLLDPLTASILFVGVLWLCRRYLFHKFQATGMGEYVLCAALALTSLLSIAVKTNGTIAVLWINAFQMLKAAMCTAGWYVLFLLLVRGLGDLLEMCSDSKKTEFIGKTESFFWGGAILFFAWLPHMIIRYPGVLMWDSYMQIKQFMGEAERWANHPPFGTLLYGFVAWLGNKTGNRNLIYFLFTMLQCGCYIAVLSYSLVVMKRLKVPGGLRKIALIVYAVSPCYVGWATVISKDTTYVVLYLLMIVLLMICLFDATRFFRGPWYMLLLGIDIALLALCRHNGAVVAALTVFGAAFMFRGKNRKALLGLCMAGLLVASGIELGIEQKLEINSRYIPDIMSIPFQQTARVVKLHGHDIPADEVDIIDKVIEYEGLAERYEVDYADAVKDTYRQTATAGERAAYWKVWLSQFMRYPVDYLDALLAMNGVLFNLQDNEPMYICFSDAQLYDEVYKWSFNDMEMYDREQLVGLNSANMALTEMYMNFHRLPVLGFAGSMSFHALLMIMMVYICGVKKHIRSLILWIPCLLTWGICLFSPVVYLRYALPFMCATPITVASYFCHPFSLDQSKGNK